LFVIGFATAFSSLFCKLRRLNKVCFVLKGITKCGTIYSSLLMIFLRCFETRPACGMLKSE
jgi:hypothetical protein